MKISPDSEHRGERTDGYQLRRKTACVGADGSYG